MMIYPADAASAYLDLYDACGERRFLEAALRIARSYRKLQLPSGSWYLKINMKDGTPVASNQCVPVPMIRLFERLGAQYGETEFRETAERAVRYLAGTTLKEFNWEGQFEDIAPSVPYVNNTKHNACDYALYLLDRFPDRPEAVEQARTLLRFAEDQFVVWEQPMPDKSTRTDQWITPCVLEQYAYYVPIDASAAKLISLYQAMYERTGSVLDLAKACELANAMTRAQASAGCWSGRNRRYNANGRLPGPSRSRRPPRRVASSSASSRYLSCGKRPASGAGLDGWSARNTVRSSSSSPIRRCSSPTAWYSVSSRKPSNSTPGGITRSADSSVGRIRFSAAAVASACSSE